LKILIAQNNLQIQRFQNVVFEGQQKALLCQLPNHLALSLSCANSFRHLQCVIGSLEKCGNATRLKSKSFLTMKGPHLPPEFLHSVIHMNGRIYDPTLGRMLQADPLIQSLGNTQSYNRYSYVLNNPLGYTDPSGYNFVKQFAGVIVGGVLVVATGGTASPFVASWYGAAGLGAITGGVGAAANGGNVLQGVAIGAFTGAATYGVATGLESQGISALSVEGVMSFGAVGGISSVASGGKFHHGFIAAGAGGIIGNTGLGGFDQAALRTVGRAIIGGTVSELTGGKFANGAATAAFASIVGEGVAAQSSQSNPSREIPVPDDVKYALEKTFDHEFGESLNVDSAAVIENSKWADFISSLNEIRTGGKYWVVATTQENTIYLNSRITAQDFFSNTELVLHEYFHVFKQWNNQRMNNASYLLSPDKWEQEARSFSSSNARIYESFKGDP
jgi:RHS repeat-associated protein